jgi:hypothetical protein
MMKVINELITPVLVELIIVAVAQIAYFGSDPGVFHLIQRSTGARICKW